MPNSTEPSETAGDQTLRKEIVRLNKIVHSLMNRAESSTNAQGSDYGLFQTTIMLQEQVRRRTEELEGALRENERITHDLRTMSAATELERKRLALILENTDDGVALVDLDGRITYANPVIQRTIETLGGERTPERFAELREICEIRHADERPLPPDESPIGEALDGRNVTDLELHLLHQSSGKQMTLLFSAMPVRNAEGAVMQAVVTMRDITERKRNEELLRSTLEALERSRQELILLASHDSLTGLLNRRRFEEEFEGQLAEQQRLGRGGALLWLDLDHFKDINDTLGHRVGDELLKLVAQALRKATRRYSVTARLGGDEFAMLIPAAQEAEALGAANRLAKVLAAQELAVAGHTVRVGVSVGVALYPDHGTSVRELLAAADAAMYHSKEMGRGRVSLYDPLHA
jgi:diguanylate cyclase (GGDEF)-like protein